MRFELWQAREARYIHLSQVQVPVRIERISRRDKRADRNSRNNSWIISKMVERSEGAHMGHSARPAAG